MARGRGRRFLRWIVAVLVWPPLIYTFVAVAFSLLLPPHPPPPNEGVEIYACDNGVHADLVLPVAAGGTDWRSIFAPEFFGGPINQFDYIGIGWGSRDFYLQTPRWADVNPRLAIKALTWDETVLRIDYRPRPGPGEDCGQWRVSEATYRRVVDFVRTGLALNAGRPHFAAAGYGAQDAFFTANGRYTIFDTCNQWTGQALRFAGAPVAAWAPFSFLVLWHLPPKA